MKPSDEIVDFTNIAVTDALVLHEDLSSKWLQFRNVEFEQAVDFSGVVARGIAFYGCRFRQGVDLSGVVLANDLVAYKSTFDAPPQPQASSFKATPALRLDSARVGGEIEVLGCTIHGGMFAENLRVIGDVDFRGSWVHKNLATPLDVTELEGLATADADVRALLAKLEQRSVGVADVTSRVRPVAFRLTGSRIEGAVRLGALYDEGIKGVSEPVFSPRMSFFAGDVQLSNIDIGGHLDLSGVITVGSLMLDHSKIGGSIHASVQQTQSRLGGGVVFARLIVQDRLGLYGVHVAGNIELGSAFVGQGFQLIFANVNGYLFARQDLDSAPRLELGSGEDGVALELSGTRCGGVECESAKIAGVVQSATGEFGRLRLTSGVTRTGPSTIAVTPCSTAGVLLRSVTVKEDVRFDGLRVSASQIPRGVTDRHGVGALSMINCEVGGELAIGADGLSSRLFESASDPVAIDAEYATTIDGRLELTGTSVNRDLVLSSLDVRPTGDADGGIVLDYVNTKGQLRISHRPHRRGPTTSPQLRTHCRTLSMTSLSTDGDLDATGLVVDEDVTGQHLRIRGDLLFADADGGAIIRGDLDLRGASASNLVLSDRNFNHGAGTLTLADTEFRQFKMSMSEVPPTLPSKIQCHNATILRWDVPEGAEFHKFTEPVQGGAYASMEKYYREAGHFDNANQVLRAMRRRSLIREETVRWWNGKAAAVRRGSASLRDTWKTRWRQVPGASPVTTLILWLIRPIMYALYQGRRAVRALLIRLRRLIVSGFRVALWGAAETVGFGTVPWWIVAAIAALFMVSANVFSNPRNVTVANDTGAITAAEVNAALCSDPATLETSRAVPTVHESDPLLPAPASACWHRADAWALAARYNIPLVGVAMAERWQPSRAELIFGIRAMDWARLMSYVNWVLWPLFLATFTSYLFRRL